MLHSVFLFCFHDFSTSVPRSSSLCYASFLLNCNCVESIVCVSMDGLGISANGCIRDTNGVSVSSALLSGNDIGS